MWNMFFLYCLFTPVCSVHCYFLFCAGFAGSSRDTPFASGSWKTRLACEQAATVKASGDAGGGPAERAGASCPELLLGARARPRQRGWRSSGRIVAVCICATWTVWLWAVTGALGAAGVTVILLVFSPFKINVNLGLFQATLVGCQHCGNIPQKLMLGYAHRCGYYHLECWQLLNYTYCYNDSKSNVC